jgi:predicted enzyme related to lactoylglutathione lyase
MSTTLYAITFDCANAKRLAEFWAAVLERRVDDGSSDQFASLGAQRDDGQPRWLFNQVPEGKRVKNRVHVDLAAAELEQEVERVARLGATKVADIDQDGGRWTTLTDPEGNEFDIVADGG